MKIRKEKSMPKSGGIMRRYLLIAFVWTLSTSAIADEGPFAFEFEELAPGVWAGVRPIGPRFPVMGNTTFVISEEGVVVYDGGGMPAMSEQVIATAQARTRILVDGVDAGPPLADHFQMRSGFEHGLGKAVVAADHTVDIADIGQ